MPCAVCACEASSTFSHVLESKEGIKLKKAHLDLFTETCSILIYIILNPKLRGKKSKPNGSNKKRWNTHFISLILLATCLWANQWSSLRKVITLLQSLLSFWFLILLCLSNSLLWHKNIWSGLFIAWQLDGDIRKKTLEEKLGYIWYLFLKIYILIF